MMGVSIVLRLRCEFLMWYVCVIWIMGWMVVVVVGVWC